MTIRFLALLTTCIALSLISLPRASSIVLVKSGNDFDIAIEGKGYLCLLNDEYLNILYTRSGNLSLNSDGQLAIEIEGKQRLIDPPIQAPKNWDRFAVLPDGRVQFVSDGHLTTAGQLQLAVLTTTPVFEDPLTANAYEDGTNVPTCKSPGKGVGVIKQGWIEQRLSMPHEVAQRVIVSIVITIILWCITRHRRTDDSVTPNHSERRMTGP